MFNMLNMLNFPRGFFWGGVCPKTREKIQHIQHFKGFGAIKAQIQHFKGFGVISCPKPLKMLNFGALSAPNPLKKC